MHQTSSDLISVRDLAVRFVDRRGTTYAVNGVSFGVASGETLGIVGESGCGKSVTALSIMRLLPPTAQVEGEIHFGGRDLLRCSEQEMRVVRGGQVSIIFQEPMASLNPSLTVGKQIVEAIRANRPTTRRAARGEAVELLERVGVQDAATIYRRYPHEVSGGMGQRVLIAMALAPRPKLLLADEPTTALDVSTQAEVLELLQSISRELGMALIIITHDMGVIARMTDTTLVMYGGFIVEYGTTQDVLTAPYHPYTAGLLASTPRLTGDQSQLVPIEGYPSTQRTRPTGCVFSPRCQRRTDICTQKVPNLAAIDRTASQLQGRAEPFASEQRVACYHPLSPGSELAPLESSDRTELAQ
jgi:peptide/nickel transport system ATP-binding protein